MLRCEISCLHRWGRFLQVIVHTFPLSASCLMSLLPHLLTPQAVDFSPLGSLKNLRVLSLSDCPYIQALPPAVAQLTGLKVRVHFGRVDGGR